MHKSTSCLLISPRRKEIGWCGFLLTKGTNTILPLMVWLSCFSLLVLVSKYQKIPTILLVSWHILEGGNLAVLSVCYCVTALQMRWRDLILSSGFRKSCLQRRKSSEPKARGYLAGVDGGESGQHCVIKHRTVKSREENSFHWLATYPDHQS